MADDITRFIILSDARTGSNLLQQALNSHPAIICFRELFNYDLEYIDFDVDGWDPRGTSDIELRGSDPRAFLRSRIFSGHPPNVRAAGFKFHYDHFWFHADLLPALTEDRELRVVHLRRANQLRMLVSLKIAEQTGEWLRHDEGKRKRQTLVRRLTPANVAHAVTHPGESANRIRRFLAPQAPPPVPEKQALTLSYDDCVRHFFKFSHEIEHFSGLFKDHRMTGVTYEDMVRDPEGELGHVQEFLEVPSQRLSWTLRKQNPEPLRELVANYDELKGAFAGAPQAVFFDE